MRFAVLSACLCTMLNGADAPRLLPRDIVSAADYSSGRVAPGQIVVLFPSNAGPAALAEFQLDKNGRVGTSTGQTRVLFDGIAAPIFYSVTGQIGAIVPYEVAKTKATQVVVEYKRVRSSPVTLPVVVSAPAFFTLDSSGKGQAAMLNETGCCNSTRNPATPGSVVVMYATGEGETTPPVISGSISKYARTADLPVPRLPLTVTVGGAPAEIIFAGAAPLAVAGLLQVNFRLPANAPLGDAVPVVLTVGGVPSPDGVTMAIQSSIKRILVLEDQPAIRRAFTEILQGAGYGVVTESDNAIDLVVASLAMPGLSESMQAMRAERPLLKIIATSNGLDPETLRAADLLGAQAVLTKPVTAEPLLQRVRDLLRARPILYVSEEQTLPQFPPRPIR